MRCCITFAALMAAVLSGPLDAESLRLSVELFGGSSYSFKTPLTVQQDGQPDIEVSPAWETRAFEESPYYAIRLGLAHKRPVWELQFLHHKIYLSNPTPELQRFEISHGLNLVTVNRVFPVGLVDLRVGAGAALAHSESIVRGQFEGGTGGLFEGYHLTGPVLMGGAGMQWFLLGGLYAAVEGQLTVVWVSVPVANGRARTTNIALHGLLGLGYRF